MCLRDPKRVDKPYDMIGYKIVEREYNHYVEKESNHYVSIFAYNHIYSTSWQQADYNFPEYGFHAYKNIKDASEAYEMFARQYVRVALLEVELSDVFLEGKDNSFEETFHLDAVTAVAMRVLREIGLSELSAYRNPITSDSSIQTNQTTKDQV